MSHYCTFLLKEIAWFSVPRLGWPVVDTVWPTSVTKIQSAWKISALAKGEPASFSAAITVNTNHNVCTSWATDELHYLLYSNEERQAAGDTEIQQRPWKPSEVGWISPFLKHHWLHREREPFVCLLNPPLLAWKHTENAPFGSDSK